MTQPQIVKTMINSELLDFLKILQQNNNRDWFHAHKADYDKHRMGFVQFAELVIHIIAEFDKSVSGLEPKDCIYRINRDIRFSNDKSPYKTNMGAFIAPGGRNAGMAGYYVHIEPNGCFLSGGIYMPTSPTLKAIRKEVYANYEEFLEIISNKEFKKHFGEFSGERLKTKPVGFPEDFEGLEYLKLKHFTVLKNKTEKEMSSPEILDEIKRVFKALHPLVKFINQAIKEN